ncbi:hypothetical protein [Limnohabitans sp.]|uniref:hypothetical protein n=1 Tax=Limnohabitans sp. TaxID=1907725 RepID=UPI00286EFDD4|nr:hypothetical protein [Limnohabitans sp.]
MSHKSYEQIAESMYRAYCKQAERVDEEGLAGHAYAWADLDKDTQGCWVAAAKQAATKEPIYTKPPAAQTAIPNKELGHFVQPHWGHVGQAFIDGAREARANPRATDDDVNRAADGYTKRLFEELDPESEQLLRANAYPQSNQPVKG